MKKIAIKYDENNWPEIKKAVDLIRSTGKTVEKRKVGNPKKDDFLHTCSSVSMGKRHGEFYYDINCSEPDYLILTMPQDMPKLKEVLGIEVPKLPQDGEVWSFEIENSIFTRRIKEWRGNNVFLSYNHESDTDYVHSTFTNDRMARIATAEEEAKLIEAEHANGYHFDGSSLVEIPEYIKCLNGFIIKPEGFFNRIDWYTNPMFLEICIDKKATKEAFEAQNKEISNPLAFTKNPIPNEHDLIKPTKRIILSQYESIEILVDEFEMVHGNGKILLLPK
jgi:hypothetical protein